jgi:hypothetical protein
MDDDPTATHHVAATLPRSGSAQVDPHEFAIPATPDPRSILYGEHPTLA